MLTKAFQKQWACALESGKYKQGSGQLRDKDDNYCCLGVAADLLAPDKWVKSGTGLCSWGMYDSGGVRRSGYLTYALRRQIGLDEDTQTKLVALNDDNKRDFKAIAQHIRSLPTQD